MIVFFVLLVLGAQTYAADSQYHVLLRKKNVNLKFVLKLQEHVLIINSSLSPSQRL